MALLKEFLVELLEEFQVDLLEEYQMELLDLCLVTFMENPR